jgi:ribosomal protein L7/L12
MAGGSHFDSSSLTQHFAAVTSRLQAIEERLAMVSRELGLPPFVGPTAGTPEEVLSLAREGKTLDALKLYRQMTGASLEEARAAVEGF